MGPGQLGGLVAGSMLDQGGWQQGRCRLKCWDDMNLVEGWAGRSSLEHLPSGGAAGPGWVAAGRLQAQNIQCLDRPAGPRCRSGLAEWAGKKYRESGSSAPVKPPQFRALGSGHLVDCFLKELV